MTEMHKDSQDLHIVLVDHLPKTRKELKKLKKQGPQDISTEMR